MAILRGTDVMRDSSVIAKESGARGAPDDHLGMTNRGNSCEGEQSEILRLSGRADRKRSRKLHSATALRMTPHESGNAEVWAGKVSSATVGNRTGKKNRTLRNDPSLAPFETQGKRVRHPRWKSGNEHAGRNRSEKGIEKVDDNDR